MGSWGTGMQASDAALDAIGYCQVYPLKGPIRLKARISVAKAIKHAQTLDGKHSRRGVLGMAEFLLDHSFDLKQYRRMLLAAIKFESRPEELETWRDPEERLDALREFARRVKGEKYDEEKGQASNEGLLSKIGRAFGG